MDLLIQLAPDSADVYWGICLCKLKVPADTYVPESDTRLASIPEYPKYLTLVSPTRRQLCMNLTKKQEEAIENRRKERERKRREETEARRRAQEEEARKRQEEEEAEKAAKQEKGLMIWGTIIGVVILVAFLGNCISCLVPQSCLPSWW